MLKKSDQNREYVQSVMSLGHQNSCQIALSRMYKMGVTYLDFNSYWFYSAGQNVLMIHLGSMEEVKMLKWMQN